jgi:hypothetical protein
VKPIAIYGASGSRGHPVSGYEHGHAVAETCRAVGAQHLDTTGERDWVLEARRCGRELKPARTGP